MMYSVWQQLMISHFIGTIKADRTSGGGIRTGAHHNIRYKTLPEDQSIISYNLFIMSIWMSERTVQGYSQFQQCNLWNQNKKGNSVKHKKPLTNQPGRVWYKQNTWQDSRIHHLRHSWPAVTQQREVDDEQEEEKNKTFWLIHFHRFINDDDYFF